MRKDLFPLQVSLSRQALVNPVPDAMAQFESAALELRRGPVEWSFATVFTPFSQFKIASGCHGFIDVFSVVGPVGGDMQGAAGLQFVGREVEEGILQQSPLVVPGFGPGIGEIEVEPAQCAVRNLLPENLQRITADKPQVGKVRFLGREHRVTDAGRMYFDANEIPPWMAGCHFNQ